MGKVRHAPNEYIAGISNFLIPGVGYVYAGKKREIFSYSLSVLTILGYYEYAMHPYLTTPLNWLISFFISAIFAYDAYLDAKE